MRAENQGFIIDIINDHEKRLRLIAAWIKTQPIELTPEQEADILDSISDTHGSD